MPVALVTGASSGIGRDIAHELSKKGYDIIAVARDEKALNELKQNIQKENNTKVYVKILDLTDREGCKKLHEEVKEKFKNTCLEKYGVENPTLNPEIRAKQIEVCVEKYGAISSLGNAEIREKGKKTMLELYGYESAGSCPELMAKAAETRKKNGNGVTTSS